MAIYTQTLALVSDIPAMYGYVESQAIAYNVSVEQINDESQSTIDGRYHHSRGYAASSEKPKIQDTFVTGTMGVAGREFAVESGSWKDKASPYYNAHIIFQPSSLPGSPWGVVSVTPTSGIEAAEIIVHRGFPGVGSVQSDYSRQNTNFYLHLAYNQAPYADVRIAGEFGQPIRMDISPDGSGSNWFPVMSSNKVITEQWFQDNNNACRIKVWYDPDTGEVWAEFGQTQLHYFLGRDSIGNIRFAGKNGWSGLEYYPNRHGVLSVYKGPQQLVAEPHSNASGGRVIVNSLTPTNSAQITVGSYTTDGMNFDFQASAYMPDSGDGIGSALPAKISDMTLLVDEVWTNRIPGDFTEPIIEQLRTVLTEETMTFDDNLRCFLTSGELTLNNYDGRYNGAFGNFAISVNSQLANTNGARLPFVRRCTGVAGSGESGTRFLRRDPTRLIFLPFVDKRVLMMVPLNNEIEYDGWCLYSAIRHIARCGNIHPMFMQNIPYYPDGIAGYDCPFPILKRGTGRNAKYRFTPEMSCWSCLLLLTQDQGYPVSAGVSLPYFTGFDTLGQLRFEPYDPLSFQPSALFTSEIPQVDNFFTFPILGQLEIGNSTAQLRSGATVQGLDPISYQLSQVHIPTSTNVRKALGYRYEALERNSRYGANPVDIAITLASVCSLASQVVRFSSIHLPGLFPGSTMLVYDRQIGMQLYVITSITSRYGSDPYGKRGARECSSIITGRNVSAYPTANGILF